MFEVSLSWIDGALQVIAYASALGLGLWVLSKIETKGKEGKR